MIVFQRQRVSAHNPHRCCRRRSSHLCHAVEVCETWSRHRECQLGEIFRIADLLSSQAEANLQCRAQEKRDCRATI